ncbi:MAG TPA: hypothetical protein VNR38_06290 [Ureibacillus sp.]|nr:hypothetical protein [Ureibacillus sp.]
MECQKCGSTNDVVGFYIGEVKHMLCVNCRSTLLSNPGVGRPSIGITKKVSLTLDEEDWNWFDTKAKGNRSQYLRSLVLKEQSPESEWSNNAALGYAILGAQKLGYSEEEIEKLVLAIYSQFDWKTVDEARDVYNKSSY